jgi:hypothetical protein
VTRKLIVSVRARIVSVRISLVAVRAPTGQVARDDKAVVDSHLALGAGAQRVCRDVAQHLERAQRGGSRHAQIRNVESRDIVVGVVDKRRDIDPAI